MAFFSGSVPGDTGVIPTAGATSAITMEAMGLAIPRLGRRTARRLRRIVLRPPTMAADHLMAAVVVEADPLAAVVAEADPLAAVAAAVGLRAAAVVSLPEGRRICGATQIGGSGGT
jgi:hypothetical protein